MNPFPKTGDAPRPREDNEQAPLGAHPSYDDVLDVAVQYTFPASDPIAVQASCGSEGEARDPQRQEGAGKGPGQTPGRGEDIGL